MSRNRFISERVEKILRFFHFFEDKKSGSEQGDRQGIKQQGVRKSQVVEGIQPLRRLTVGRFLTRLNSYHRSMAQSTHEFIFQDNF